MLIQILPKLWIGDRHACSQGVIGPGHSPMTEPFACVHAAKHPCHMLKVGQVATTHPHYLWLEEPLDLYLNMIDADEKYFRPSLFWRANQFIDHHIKTKRIVIHCNQAKSRSAAIAMVYAVHAKLAPQPFLEACEWLSLKSPTVELSDGLCKFLSTHWQEVIAGENSQSQAAESPEGAKITGSAVQTPAPEQE